MQLADFGHRLRGSRPWKRRIRWGTLLGGMIVLGFISTPLIHHRSGHRFVERLLAGLAQQPVLVSFDRRYPVCHHGGCQRSLLLVVLPVWGLSGMYFSDFRCEALPPSPAVILKGSDRGAAWLGAGCNPLRLGTSSTWRSRVRTLFNLIRFALYIAAVDFLAGYCFSQFDPVPAFL